MRKCEVKYMQKYYTAVGRFERKGHMGDMTCPMVISNKREYVGHSGDDPMGHAELADHGCQSP